MGARRLVIVDVRSGRVLRTIASGFDFEGVHSAWAVWGPRWIVFSHSRKPPRANEARKLDLYLIKPSGARLHQLTHIQPGPSLAGLRAVAWSASGNRLLAEMVGNDVTFAVTVDPVTGAVRRVGSPAQGLVGYALSRDGAAILATNGGSMPKDTMWCRFRTPTAAARDTTSSSTTRRIQTGTRSRRRAVPTSGSPTDLVCA